MIACDKCRTGRRLTMRATTSYTPKTQHATASGAVRYRWYLCERCGHRRKTVEMAVINGEGGRRRTTEATAIARAISEPQITIRDGIIRSIGDDLRRALKSIEEMQK